MTQTYLHKENSAEGKTSYAIEKGNTIRPFEKNIQEQILETTNIYNSLDEGMMDKETMMKNKEKIGAEKHADHH